MTRKPCPPRRSMGVLRPGSMGRMPMPRRGVAHACIAQLLAALGKYGFANKTTDKAGEPLVVVVIIMLDTVGYKQDATAVYKAKADKSGTAKVVAGK